MWITGIKIFPQTSIHWMFHHFGLDFFCFFHIPRITSLACSTELLTNSDKSLGVSALPQMEKRQLLPIRSCEIIYFNSKLIKIEYFPKKQKKCFMTNHPLSDNTAEVRTPSSWHVSHLSFPLGSEKREGNGWEPPGTC